MRFKKSVTMIFGSKLVLFCTVGAEMYVKLNLCKTLSTLYICFYGPNTISGTVEELQTLGRPCGGLGSCHKENAVICHSQF